MSKKTKKPNPDYNEVQLLEAKPNRMFPAWMTQRLRFMRFVSAVPCACCGKRSKHHWTMLMSFRATRMEKQFLVLKSEPTVHLPLTPVCRDHPLSPMLPFVRDEPKTETRRSSR